MPKVLVIDDSPTILKVVQLVLTKAGYEVMTAEDGDDGLLCARATPPDLILLDFVMPRVNGYQVCLTLQQESALSHIPVVLMSAKGDQVGDRFVKSMGIVDYVTKPFSPEAITAVVEHTIKKYAQQNLSQPDLLTGVALPPQDAAAAAVATLEARHKALRRFADGLASAALRSVMSHAAEQTLVLDESQVRFWIDQALSSSMLEAQLAELGAAAPELIGQDGIVLAGDLRAIPLVEVLLLLQQQSQTGTLTVVREGTKVDLFFRQGAIDLAVAAGVSDEFLLGRFILESALMSREDLDVFLKTRAGSSRLLGQQLVKLGYLNDAALKQAMRLQSSELVYETLRWSFGHFSFHKTMQVASVAAEAALCLSVDGLLMEGLRRVDEWHLIEREIENFDLVFVRNDDALSRLGRGALTREEMSVLEQINGRNSVRDVIRISRMSSFEVSKLLYRLQAIKLIRRRVQAVVA